MEILRKATVSAYFRAIRSKLCGNCAFPQNLHTKKLGEITVFYAMRVKPYYLKQAKQSIFQEKFEPIDQMQH